MDKFNFIKISSVDSTNDYALSLRSKKLFREGLVIVAEYQYKGRGQRTNIWESKFGKNLLLSFIFEPKILLSEQFVISKIVCLSVIDFLISFGIKATIKWPNDILFKNRKIAGVLIENIVSKGVITHSVIGIGVNINQLIFEKYKPNATSLSLELEKNVDILNYISNHNSLRPKLVIGFAAETNNLEKYANEKLNEKNCDWIIANDVSNKKIGFESDFNEVSIFYKNKNSEKLKFKPKSEISDEVVEKIINHLN